MFKCILVMINVLLRILNVLNCIYLLQNHHTNDQGLPENEGYTFFVFILNFYLICVHVKERISCKMTPIDSH